MKKLFLFLLGPLLASAQAETAKGTLVYRNFGQFRDAKPETRSTFTLKARTEKQILWYGGSAYELSFPDKSVSKRFIKDSIWAVTDGGDTYINNNLASVNKGFNTLIRKGFPMSYFVGYILLRDEQEERAALVSSFGALGGGMASMPYRRVIAIDGRNGSVIRMNEAGFSKLLENDPELMERYKAVHGQKDNEAVLFSILDAYNEKYGK